jgi:uncharacterized repeat protein (TIGR03943 family)
MKMLINILLILLFGIYNLYLYFTGNLDNYISQRFFTFNLFAAILSIVASVGMLVYYLLKDKGFWRDIKSSLHLIGKILLIGFVAVVGILFNLQLLIIAIILSIVLFKDTRGFFQGNLTYIFPIATILLGFLLPPASLSSITAYQREGDFNNASIALTTKPTLSAFSNTNSYEISDWIASLSFNPDLDDYKGKQVNITGFIFAKEGLPDDVFLAARFIVSCCAVDARPVGLRVKYPWRGEFEKDTWVRVSGTFDIDRTISNPELIIIAEKLEEIEEPDNPYIF